ncbi:MAG: AEC family transporter [Parcubacteria group bacterium]|nr:AEC family transporter [Parcubacteria group bacterium]
MQIITIIIQLYFIIALGVILSRVFKLDNKIISHLVIYILGPALVLYGVYIGEYNLQTAIIPGIYILVHLIILLLAYIYSKIFKYNFEDQSIILFLAWAGNNGNFGIPVVLFLLGEEALAMASLLVLINSVFIYGPGAYFMGRKKNAFKKSVIKVIKMPLLYSVILGLILSLFKIEVPDFVINPIKIVGEAAIPLSLILLGTFLAKVKINKIKWSLVAPALIFKLIIMPIIALILLRIMNIALSRDACVMVIMAAAPLAVMSVLFADLYKKNPKQVALANFLSLLFVPITLTLFWWFINL